MGKLIKITDKKQSKLKRRKKLFFRTPQKCLKSKKEIESEVKQSKKARKKERAKIRRVEALKMRKEGYSYPQIAEYLNVSLSMAYKYVQQAIKEIQDKTIEATKDVIELEVQRLDDLLAAIWDRAVNGYGKIIKDKNNQRREIVVPDYKATQQALKIMERRSNLLGLDSPKKQLVGEDQDNKFGYTKEDEEKLYQKIKLMGEGPKAGKGGKNTQEKYRDRNLELKKQLKDMQEKYEQLTNSLEN